MLLNITGHGSPGEITKALKPRRGLNHPGAAFYLGGKMKAYRVRDYKIRPNGARGASISFPATLIKDLGAKVGESLSIYRGEINGIPVAILANIDAPELTVEERG
jgi:hypothetical protein